MRNVVVLHPLLTIHLEFPDIYLRRVILGTILVWQSMSFEEGDRESLPLLLAHLIEKKRGESRMR